MLLLTIDFLEDLSSGNLVFSAVFIKIGPTGVLGPCFQDCEYEMRKKAQILQSDNIYLSADCTAG